MHQINQSQNERRNNKKCIMCMSHHATKRQSTSVVFSKFFFKKHNQFNRDRTGTLGVNELKIIQVSNWLSSKMIVWFPFLNCNRMQKQKFLKQNRKNNWNFERKCKSTTTWHLQYCARTKQTKNANPIKLLFNIFFFNKGKVFFFFQNSKVLKVESDLFT